MRRRGVRAKSGFATGAAAPRLLSAAAHRVKVQEYGLFSLKSCKYIHIYIYVFNTYLFIHTYTNNTHVALGPKVCQQKPILGHLEPQRFGLHAGHG